MNMADNGDENRDGQHDDTRIVCSRAATGCVPASLASWRPRSFLGMLHLGCRLILLRGKKRWLLYSECRYAGRQRSRYWTSAGKRRHRSVPYLIAS
jgi:hypothetical protein